MDDETCSFNYSLFAIVCAMRIVLICLLFSQLLFAGVLSDWRGPNRDGHYPETNLATKWPSTGPKLVWEFEGLGKGHTSAAVAGDKIFTTGILDDMGHLFAFNLHGTLLWKKAYGPEWTKNYAGTRSTPIVVDDLIYLVSGQGDVLCLSAKDGATQWSINMHQKFQAPVIDWGLSEQLLVKGERVYCTPGGPFSVVALNRFTGDVIWKSKNNGESSAYCSPMWVKHTNRNMLITLLQKSVIGIDGDSGELLWRHPHVAPYDIHANIPMYTNGHVYFQAGEGGTGQLLKIAPDGKSVSVVWESTSLDALTGAMLIVDDFIYGSGYNTNGFQCLDLKTGAPTYVTERFLRANVIYADGLIYAYSEDGMVGLIKANPQKFELISSFEINKGRGPHWAHLVIKNGRLYVRHENALLVYDIAQ